MSCPLSIIITTYNRGHMLPRMLDSLRVQTFSDYELILVNNGSTDEETGKVCQKYAREDPRIRIFNVEVNQGSAYGRNYGLDQAQGDYVLMVDDDDYCKPEMLECLYSMATGYDADIASVGCQNVYGTDVVDFYVYDGVYVLEGHEGIAAFLERKLYNTNPGSKMFRRQLFDGLRWREGTIVDDIHFIYKLFVAAKRVVSCGKPLYLKYKHGGNVTNFLSGDRINAAVLDEYLDMQNDRVDYICRYMPMMTEQVKYARVSYMISMVERIELGGADGCERQLDEMKQYLREHQEELLNTRWTTERERVLMVRYVLRGR